MEKYEITYFFDQGNLQLTFKIDDVFLCPIGKMRSILWAQKNVVEEIATKGDSPAGNFWNLKLPNRQFYANRVLGGVIFVLLICPRSTTIFTYTLKIQFAFAI